MKKIVSALFSSLLFALLLCSLAVPAFASAPMAEAPEWNEGDRWGYGVEVDFGEDLGDLMANLTDLLEMVDEVQSVNELSADGGSEFWMLFEVTDVTEDSYVMDMDLASMVTLDAALSVTASMPVAGTYHLGDEIETENMTISLEAGAEVTLVVNVEITYDKETMAIEAVSLSAKLLGTADFTGENIPHVDRGFTNTTYRYEDYDVHAELKADLDLDLTFDPCLNIWDFPMSVNDTWWSNFTASLSGNLTGYLDVQGLPDDVEDEIFNDEFVEETGITGFPIVFEDIEGDEGSPIDKGVIGPFDSGEIDLWFNCTDYFEDLYDMTNVYEIRVMTGGEGVPFAFYYSSDAGFMAAFKMDAGELNETVGGMIDEDMTTMASSDPDVVEENINEIVERQGELEEDDGILGFFTDPPYL
ncbi:MAG TPA: hypothetical protein PLJ11_03650, partial [Methanomassiliicoccales archaeon]|nr:hypothetical protein [Methanomassiliicoccales archaeon]